MYSRYTSTRCLLVQTLGRITETSRLCRSMTTTRQSEPSIPDGDERPLTAFEKKLAESKELLKWRTPYNERESEWYSKFKVFAPTKNEDVDIIAFLQQPIDLSLTSMRQRRERKRVKIEKYMQQFVAERHRKLGNDLATAHFLVYRGGAVKFTNQSNWIKMTKDGEYTLPSLYDASWTLEAIRCDDMELYYEGLENVRRLHHLKFLSFRNVKEFDDWCLDRISGSELTALEVLDLSGTKVTERGLGALYRIPTLKMLIVDDAQQSKSYEITCAMLEELMPEIKITNAATIHN